MTKQEEDLNNLRHSTAHLLAAAVLELYPDAKPTIGPVVENGFYYDFDLSTSLKADLPQKISDEDLSKIETKMHEVVKGWKDIEGQEVSLYEAKEMFSDNPYKLELIEDLAKEDQKITIYESGNFVDLCRGGHIKDPQKIKHFKLLSVAGAYWRGDEGNKMLTRIYGTAFPTQQELDEYIHQQEEAKKRDHRKLGKELDLFTFSDLVGSGFPLYTPRGAFIRRSLTDYIEELQSKEGYQQVWTPQVAKGELFKKSGHYDKYKDDMFNVISHYSKEEFFLKPMNCPQHTQIYGAKQRSYRELPLRFTDFAMLYRDEKPGELNGLARVRSFSQDDCHIFCREDQVDEEVDLAIQMVKKVMETFGFKYRYRLSTRDPQHPEKYLGHPEVWDKVEKWAVEIMKRNKIEYYDGPGEAAFYAPKMDLMATDTLGREWQLSTIQIDFVMPERFDLTYIDSDGQVKRPVMLHRAILGSPERFMMILLEHYAGALPVWLSPVQVKIIPITDKNLKYAQKVLEQLSAANIRAQMDDRSEKMQGKIRDAQLQKIPYMLIIGEKEEKKGTVSVRNRTGEEHGTIKVKQFIYNISREIETKS